MAVNLVGQAGLERAAALLESSFAQFQADRGVVGIVRQARQRRQQLDELTVICDRGDFAEYEELRRELSGREGEAARQRSASQRAEALRSLEVLRRGDIIRVPGGRRAGIAVILDPGLPAGPRYGRAAGENLPLPLVLTANRQVKRLSAADFPVPVAAIERIRIPNSFSARSAKHRRDLAATVRNKLAASPGPARRPAAPGGQRAEDQRAEVAEQAEITRLRRRLRQHPCHGCPDLADHVRQAEQRARLAREVAGLEAAVAGRTHVIARTFERVCAVLEHLGYLDGGAVTPDGRRLADLYTELDLLAAECVRRGLWDGLGPDELAACVSALTFESRQSEDAGPPRLPGRPGARGARLDGQDLGRTRRNREGPPAVVPARARHQVRVGRACLGAREAAGDGARARPDAR